MSTLKEQRQAVSESAKALEKELARNNYDEKLQSELQLQLDWLKDAIVSLQRLEQLSALIKVITE